jgi:hypothetical protein
VETSAKSVVYVDDDSDTVHAKDEKLLRNLIEKEAGNQKKPSDHRREEASYYKFIIPSNAYVIKT